VRCLCACVCVCVVCACNARVAAHWHVPNRDVLKSHKNRHAQQHTPQRAVRPHMSERKGGMSLSSSSAEMGAPLLGGEFYRVRSRVQLFSIGNTLHSPARRSWYRHPQKHDIYHSPKYVGRRPLNHAIFFQGAPLPRRCCMPPF